MSFSQDLENIIIKYIDRLSLEFKISRDDLLKIWNGNSSSASSSSINAELNKLTKQELMEMCKVKTLKVSGTKNDLIKRLDEYEISKSKQHNITQKKEESNSVLEKITKVPVIEIRRNEFGNFEHKDTSFVFNQETNKVYGKQHIDGSILSLTPEDINICNKFKFNYDIPLNMNIANEKVNELNDLDDEYVEVEEEELDVEIEEDDDENNEEEELEEEYE